MRRMTIRKRARMRYSDHVDELIALVRFLALTEAASRTPRGLARDLSLDRANVDAVLFGFPGIFRRSPNPVPTEEGPLPGFTLHCRYAQRDHEKRARAEDRAEVLPVLQAEYLRMMLQFISDQATAEQAGRQATGTLVVASLAALAATGGVIVQLFG